MATYKVIARGYDGVRIREVGEVFEFNGKQGSWMELVKDAPAAPDHHEETKIKRRNK